MNCTSYNNVTLCGSTKYPYPPHGRPMEITRVWGGGGSKAKILKGKYGAKLEFPEGWGDSNQKKLPLEGYGHFLEVHIIQR